MKPFVLPLSLALAVAALPGTALAEAADFLTAKKVACAPDRVTRCKSAGVECESKPASERDKAQVLVIDFGAKQVFMRRADGDKPFGVVVEDKVEGEARSIVLARSADDRRNALNFKLMKDGKMNGTRDEGKVVMETTCKAEG